MGKEGKKPGRDKELQDQIRHLQDRMEAQNAELARQRSLTREAWEKADKACGEVSRASEILMTALALEHGTGGRILLADDSLLKARGFRLAFSRTEDGFRLEAQPARGAVGQDGATPSENALEGPQAGEQGAGI